MTWNQWLADRLGTLLRDPALPTVLLADPGTDLFQVGLSSLTAFTLLDELADLDIEIDFTDLARIGTYRHLLAQVEAAGVPAP